MAETVQPSGPATAPEPAPDRAPATDDRIDILLVDDNADYLLLIRRTLEQHDSRYRVCGMSRPEDAYALLEQRTFDLVLLDYRFEKGNGLEVIRALKGKSEYVPTVMVTAFGDEGLAIQAMREGALDFVPKTSGFVQALPEVVARAIDRGRIIRERIRTQETMARRNAELQVLNDVASTINTTRDPDEILRVAREGLTQLFEARSCTVHLLDDAGRSLIAKDRVDPGSRDDRLDLDEDLDSTLVRAARSHDLATSSPGDGDRNRLVVPLLSHDRPVGTITLELPDGAELQDADRVLAAYVGKQVGDAVAHARLHHALLVTEDFLKDLVGNAGDEIVTLDPWGQVITWNAGAEKIYGYQTDAVVGRDWEILWPAEQRGEAKRLLAEVVEYGRTIRNLETVRVTAAGDHVDMLLTLSPLRRADGTIRGVASMGKNVTTEKQLQAQLVQSEKMAAVGQLISGVAHELNNPLTAVLGYAQLVSSTNVGERLEGYLTRIATEASRCQRIVQNLLSFARKHEPRAERLSLNTVVRDTLDLRAYDLRVHDIEVSQELAEELPTTLADAHQLQQVFVNLINNAQHAVLQEGTGGRLLISTRTEPARDGRPPIIVVAFADDGPGIPPALREKVFDPFFTTKAVGEGTGLGLSLSYGIVQEHGGRIRLGQSPLGGACFEVCLPVLREVSEVQESAEGEAAVTGPAMLIPPGARAAAESQEGRRILVVDDEPALAEMFTDILARDGHSIDTAPDGRQALHRIEGGEPYDLIIVDLQRREFDGDRLYREVRDLNPQLAGRMLFAGDGCSPELQRLQEVAQDRFICKPFGVDDVRRRVNAFFEDTA